MYLPKAFSEERIEVLLDFIKRHSLATVITAGPEGILANLIPVSFHSVGEKIILRFHLAKINPQVARLKAGDNVLLTFNGPQSYISPDYYASKKVHGKVVPTWNYSVVQVRGKLSVVDDPDWLLQQITDLTNAAESDFEHPWKVNDAPVEFTQAILKAVIGAELAIETIEGKFKMSQNQPEENRDSVERALRAIGKHAVADLVAKNK